MTSTPRNPAIAAILSLFLPGLGQLYCGRVARAMAIAAIGSIALIILGFAIRNGSVVSTLITEMIIGSIFSIAVTVDAWLVAKKAPQDYVPDERNRIASYIWYAVLITVSAILIGVIQADQIGKHLNALSRCRGIDESDLDCGRHRFRAARTLPRIGSEKWGSRRFSVPE